MSSRDASPAPCFVSLLPLPSTAAHAALASARRGHRRARSPYALTDTAPAAAPQRRVPPPPRRRVRRPAHPADTAYTDYARELAEHPLLSHAEERALLRQASFLRVHEQLRAKLAHDAGAAPPDEECAAHLGLTPASYQARRRRALRARDRLVTANLRLVVKVASMQHKATAHAAPGTKRNDLVGISFTDLIQEGSLALIRAAELFDTSRGERFSSYAFRAIWSRCRRAATPASCIVSIPERLKVAANKLAKFRKDYRQEHGSKPSKELEAAVSPKENLERVRECQQHLHGGVYLDRPLRGMKNEGATTVLDTLTSQRLAPEDVVHQELVRRRVREACDKQLSKRDADVLALKFGLDDGKPVLAKHIAELFGISAPRVTQIVLQALEKLRVNEPELALLIHDL